MSYLLRIVVVLLAGLAAIQWWSSRGPVEPPVSASAQPPAIASRYPSFLPPEAIERGGPYRYDRDGSTFQNRERRLPEQPRGYYREYTVETPGSPDRGARRIVSGGDPPEVYYYTDDHYRSFRRVEIEP
jgi:guanyl-specific ribonuclease Sa